MKFRKRSLHNQQIRRLTPKSIFELAEISNYIAYIYIVHNVDTYLMALIFWTIEQIAIIEIALKEKQIITEDCQRTDLFLCYPNICLLFAFLVELCYNF